MGRGRRQYINDKQSSGIARHGTASSRFLIEDTLPLGVQATAASGSGGQCFGSASTHCAARIALTTKGGREVEIKCSSSYIESNVAK